MKIDNKETYADFIKKLRFQLKYTREEFAKIIGVEKTSIYLWETGKKVPSFRNQRKIDNLAKDL